MKHHLLLIAVFALFTVCCAAPPIVNLPQAKPTKQELYKHIGQSSVALVLTTKDGDIRPYCTGVFVAQDQILTANHCAEVEPTKDDDEDGPKSKVVGAAVHYMVEAEVDDPGKEPTGVHLGKVLYVDIEHDLALIKAVGRAVPQHETISLEAPNPKIGDHLYVVGMPRGLYWTYVEGNVGSVRMSMEGFGVPLKGPFLQVSAPVYFGNSGGGAFNEYGELIGISSFVINGSRLFDLVPNTGFFIHIESIRSFMDEANSDK